MLGKEQGLVSCEGTKNMNVKWVLKLGKFWQTHTISLTSWGLKIYSAEQKEG